MFGLIYVVRNFNIFFIRRQNSRILIPNLMSVINTFSDMNGFYISLSDFLMAVLRNKAKIMQNQALNAVSLDYLQSKFD